MRVRKLLLPTLGAVAILGALASTAFARSFRASFPTQRATYTTIEFAGPFGSARCPLTLTGEIHSSLPKTAEALIGYFSSAERGACTAGSLTLLTVTLPWHIRYSGFQGNLPSITRILTRIIGFEFKIRETGLAECLVRTTATEPLLGNYSRRTEDGVLTELGLGGEIRTGVECFNVRGTFRSTPSSLRSGGGTQNIVVTLI